MNATEDDRRLDALLDQMLEVYSAVEPCPGFETRIRTTMQSHVAHRQRRAWLLTLASSMAAVVLVIWLTQGHIARREVTDQIVVRRPEALPAHPSSSVPVERKPEFVSTAARVAHPIRNSNQVLLKLANLAHSSELPAFENKKVYVEPAPEMQSGAGAEMKDGEPQISIEKLGVRSLEIKELAPARDSEKGDL